MTTASGTATSILAPATAGAYRMFVVDLAGNISTQSTAILTVDNTPPTLTPVTPISSATIHDATTSISITNSEALASGSITVTYSGGTADGASPHICTFKGTGLNSGAHTINFTDTTNGCTSAQTLVNGAVYSFAFNATDLAGNNATTVTSTGVTFANAHTLTIPASTGSGSGSYGGTSAGSVAYNTAVSITATPASDSNFTSWTATGAAASCNGSTSSPCAFSMTSAASVTAVYTLKIYTLTYIAGANGSITGSTTQVVSSGGSGSLVTAVANSGYHFTSWSDGVLTASRTDTNVLANITVTASFAINTFTLTYIAGANGTISGSSTQVVSSGGSGSAVTAVANSGYHFTSWSDGVLTASRTDTNVLANITVTASFAINTFTLTYIAGSNGSITGSTTQVVSSGGSGSLVTAVANSGYHFTSWSDGVLTASRTDTNVLANITVTASFAINTFTLTYIAGANGTISGSSTQVVSSGGSGSAVTAVANSGYHFTSWSDGVLTASRTDTNVLANITVTASFAIDTETVTYNKNGGDTEASPISQTVNYNTSVGTLPTAPTRSGYTFDSWNTQSDGLGSTFTSATAVTSNITVYAKWTNVSYTLTIPASLGNGSGSYGGTSAGSVAYNTLVSITATPNISSDFTSWTATGAASSCNGSTTSPCTFSMTGDASVTAAYTLNQYTLTYTAGTNGSITGSTTQTVASGGSGSLVTAIANSGYHFTSWSDGVLTASRTDTNVLANITVTASFAINIITLNHFEINTIGSQTEGIAFGMTITAKDTSGGTMTSFNGTVDFTVNAGTVSPSTSGSFVNGIKTETITLTSPGVSRAVTVTHTGGTATGTSNLFTVNSPVTQFVIINPTDSTVGNNVTVRVEAQDIGGNIVSSYSNNVTLNASGNATGEGTVNIISGFGTIDITDQTAETVELTLSDTHGLIGTSTQDVVFSPGSLHHFILDNIPSPQIAGEDISVTVTAKDLYDNIVPSFVGSVNFSTTAGTITPLTSSSFTAGILTQNIKVTLSGAGKTITVTNTSGSQNGTSNSFAVNPGVVDKYVLNSPSDILVGTRAAYTVTRKDQNNNLVTSGSSTVFLTASTGTFYDANTDGNIITQTNIPDTQSLVSFWYLGDTPGVKTITASDNSPADGNTGIDDMNDTITVTSEPIVATRLVIIDTTPTVAGDTFSVIVRAVNDAGSVDSSYNGTVNLATTGPLPRPVPETLTPGGIVTISGGEGTINIVDTKAETVSLSLNSPSSALDVSSTKSIDFLPGVFSYFIMDSISSPQNAGVNIPIIIKAFDTNGNVATSFNGTVGFSTNAGSVTPVISNNFISGILSQNISVTQSGINKTITATKTSDTQYYTSNTFEVKGGPVATFSVEASGGGDITTKTVNVPFDIKITAKDAHGNVATGFTSKVNISSTGVISSGGGETTSFTDGVLSAHSVAISNSGSFTVTATNSSGSEFGISNSFSVSPVPIVATKFVINNPLDVQVGQSTTVTIEAVDNSGNRDDTFQGDIILSTSGSATGGGLVDIVNGVGTKVITDPVIETVILSLSDIVPPTTLNFSSTENVVFSATPPSGGGGGGGGGSSVVAPVVYFSVKAFPQANLEILAISDDKIPVSGTSNKSNNGLASGNYNIGYNGKLPNDVKYFALVVYDKNKNIAQTKIFKMGVNNQLLQNVLMAPTVDLRQQIATRGAFMGLTGQAMPDYKIELTIDGVKVSDDSIVDASGNYSLVFNTYPLSVGIHNLRVRQFDNTGKYSDFSIEKSFSITSLFIPKADLNNDGKVDITDLSIFMTRYRSSDVIKPLELDLNSDGKVDSTDLSLLLKALTK